ncbi:OpgC family protein [Szabonella alba]|uniref:OpgC family protein n=1 Tax=Szabonella alba TaxID=2804194 RepID=UPI001F31AB05|nr:OpgC domain-containing protein [Szabonella alba]
MPASQQPAAPQPATLPPAVRDPRLDVIRGLCLVMIFINHVPGNWLEVFTTRNFGFSDAAEGFVIMSGIAAGLAYGPYFRAPMRVRTGLSRCWSRAWTLYLVHILTCMVALGLAAASVRYLGASEIFLRNNMAMVWQRPLEVLIGLPALTHQFGYVNILPMYLVLLLATPFALIAAWRWPGWLLAGSVALWAAAAWFRLGPPNYPQSGIWFFNPLSWQLIFVIGLMTGVRIRQGRRLVPVRGWLLAICLGWLVFAALAAQVPAINKALGETLWALREATNAPWFLVAFDKTYVSGPRLTHILALAYVLSALPVVWRVCAHRAAAPLALLGRQALPVFALGSMLCIGAQGVRLAAGGGIWLDLVLIATGLSAQLALAAARQYWPKDAAPRA